MKNITLSLFISASLAFSLESPVSDPPENLNPTVSIENIKSLEEELDQNSQSEENIYEQDSFVKSEPTVDNKIDETLLEIIEIDTVVSSKETKVVAPRISKPYPAPKTNHVRIQGKDRYETSANIALATCGGGCDNVYIASGVSYSDGITISPLAIINKGAMLLVEKDRVPSSIISALKKITPKNIYIAGGANSVSESVTNELQKTTGAKIKRFAGKNRFETSQMITDEYDNPNGVYLTTGTNWPDALAIAPLAGLNNWPILLTEGNNVGSNAITFLEKKTPKSVTFIGGKYSSEERNKALIASWSNGMESISGPDRYGTALDIAKFKYPNSTGMVYVSGANFADALGGATIAAASKLPIVLLRPGCSSDKAVEYSKNKKAILLGGEKSTPTSAIGKECIVPTLTYNTMPPGSPAWIVMLRSMLNEMKGGNKYELTSFDGTCGATKGAIGCATLGGKIMVHKSLASYPKDYQYLVLAHELAHQYQFKVWYKLDESPTFKKLYNGNGEILANCMATASGYKSEEKCSPIMLSWAKNIWNEKVVN